AVAFLEGTTASAPIAAWIPFLHTVLGTVSVASGAATLNQWMERRFDARMRRTSRRPIAGGRIEPIRALMFGTFLSAAGSAYLAAFVGVVPALLAIGTLFAYLFVYTPAKRITPLCTLLGAVPGATPALIGWSAARGHLELEAWVLFAIVFLWQFPHFMAIAWMYRDDYDRAGYRVLPNGRARGGVFTLQILLPLLALIPVSQLVVAAKPTPMTYRIGALLSSLAFLYYGT